MQNLLQDVYFVAMFIFIFVSVSAYPITYYIGFRKWVLLLTLSSSYLIPIFLGLILQSSLLEFFLLFVFVGSLMAGVNVIGIPAALWHRKLLKDLANGNHWLQNVSKYRIKKDSKG